MRRKSFWKRAGAFVLGLQLLVASAFAGIPAGYYDTADTGSAAALRASLNDIITAGHDNVGYSSAYPALHNVWEDTGNSSNVIMIYTADSRAKSLDCTTSGCEDGAALTGEWNREHIFPQSEFNQTEPERSDLHALFPSDSDVNNNRSNKAYGEVASNQYTLLNGTGCSGNTTTFEPRDDQKGDVARALFYMTIRYEGEGGDSDLEVVNGTSNTVTSDGQIGDLATLLLWHADDPVDAFEESRNDQIQVEQGNRNPFIDHPEWVSIIWGGGVPTTSDGDTVMVASTDRAPASAASGDVVPMLSVVLTANSNEWDLGSLTVNELGTIGDSGITAVRAYRDSDQDGEVDGSETLLASSVLTGGAATLSLSPSARSTAPSAVHVLLVAELAPGAAPGDTVQLEVAANSLDHAASGGADVDPTHAVLTSGTTTVTAPSGIFFSEYVEGSSNNKAVEIYNATGTTYDFASTPFKIQQFANGSATATSTINITSGTMAAGGTFVVGNTSAGVGITGVADLLSGSLNFNGNDAIVLTDDTNAILDVIGQVGFDPGTEWGTGLVSTMDNTLRRLPRIVQGDTNGADVFDPSIEWLGFATDTFGDLGSHVVDRAPSINSIAVANVAEDMAGTVVVSFTDGDDSAAGIYSASAMQTSRGGTGFIGAGVIAKTGTGTYTATFNYAPAADFNGIVTFDTTVSDATGPITANGLTFEVLSINDFPMFVTAPGNQITTDGVAVGPLGFDVSDVETAAASLLVSGSSSNQTLLPDANITFGGAGISRTVTLSPVPGQTGSATVTLTIEDGESDTTSIMFDLQVNAGSTVPDWQLQVY